MTDKLKLEVGKRYLNSAGAIKEYNLYNGVCMGIGKTDMCTLHRTSKY